MKIEIDMDLCDSHGQCVFAAPEVFSFDENDYVVYDAAPDDTQHEAVARAIAACPVRAIRMADR
ncbi:ferredoxin [Streptomyces sp. SLBN-31]|uniref:ferredoxin n=1 Tax=Streptomyces sp. SLBN-31 TaxID=2768444 RepID=UPI001153C33B|nr:ferredoxin [Streptomyces sp. SLBN-31]TQJ92962.1 ferredoxin [Streptomyces sp. SLBN-31]